ncbi:MAG: acyl-CoA dehydrogenase family protein, partial [Rhodospirillales bacterium]|nr:acyl-CoA dehydrogenase family protein [Rhodospirillales bacterium]
MDFSLSPAVEKTRAAVRAFVERELIPLEAHDINWGDGENVRLDVLQKLRAKAKKAKLWSLQMPEALGGGGLDTVGMAVCYEEMGRALFGPVVFNSAAPDDGNMMVLGKVATAAQKKKWLAPIVDGRVRSAFAMTEPHPGSG